MTSDFLKKVLEQEQPRAEVPPEDPATYRPFKVVTRPQMGFSTIRANGDIDGFLYHNLDNLSLRHGERAEFLTFTHRGKAVTIQGHNLRPIFQAMMGHNLVEIREQDGRPAEPDKPFVARMVVSLITEAATAGQFPSMSNRQGP